MANIYDTLDWSGSTTYKKNNVVKYLGNYFYSLIDNNTNNTPSVSSASWGGQGIDPVDNSQKAEFIWSPSYNLNIDISPRVKIIKFGDGFRQILPDSINSSLINLECVFDGRDTNECLAILHFLLARNGTETFLFTCPPPLNKKKRFKCNSFPMSINFYENNSIRCIFEESPI